METSKCPLPMCMMPDGADPCEGYQALRRQLEQVEAEVARLYGLLDEIAEKRIYWLHEMRDERLPVGEVLNSFRAILARRNKEADDD